MGLNKVWYPGSKYNDKKNCKRSEITMQQEKKTKQDNRVAAASTSVV